MRSLEDAIEVIKKLHQTKYPEALTIFLAGSITRNEFTAKSDLDIIIIFPTLPNAYREAYLFEGWMIDAFVHDEATLNYFFNEVDKTSLSPGLPSMVYEGIELPQQTPLGDKLKKQAAEILGTPPTLDAQQLANRRFHLTDLLDDLNDPRNQDERLAILQELYLQMGEFYLLANGQWIGSGKNLIRKIKEYNPKMAQDFTESFAEAYATPTQPKLDNLALNILNAHGGKLWADYHSDAPQNFKKEPPKNFGALVAKNKKKYPIILEEADNTQAAADILAGVRAYNITHLGIYHRKHFVLYLQDDNHKTLAGLTGEYLETLCTIHLVWITEELRGLHIGTELLLKLEEYIKPKGCSIIQLDTTEFQAKPFYEKLDYKVVATLPKGFKGHVQWVMRKEI